MAPISGHRKQLNDEDRPKYHIMSSRGWASDPSGPVYYKGRYHMFFQHNPESCQWHWGLSWDHVVSDDLVTWKKLPPAVIPTPGWYDADGCFTGAVEIDPENGLPVLIYTGVYLKNNEEAVHNLGLPPPEYDLQLRFVETQLAAVPEDPDDPDLVNWRKLPDPVIRYPPANVPLSCWRDPYIVQRGDLATGQEWVMLLASGVRNVGGAVIQFRSKQLLSGWEYTGMLVNSDNAALGIDWECPILTELHEGQHTVDHAAHGRVDHFTDLMVDNKGSTQRYRVDEPHAIDQKCQVLTELQEKRNYNITQATGKCARNGAVAEKSRGESRWFFCMSPDACNNPIYYWLGRYDGERFDLSAAEGPYKIDLGRTLYAAGHWIDPKGRQLLWGWLQEHKRVATPPAVCCDFQHAGCLSTPRILTLEDGRLFQEPIPEVDALRTKVHWETKNLRLFPSANPIPLPVVSGLQLDIIVTFMPPHTPPSTSPSATTAPALDLTITSSVKFDGKTQASMSSWATQHGVPTELLQSVLNIHDGNLGQKQKNMEAEEDFTKLVDGFDDATLGNNGSVDGPMDMSWGCAGNGGSSGKGRVGLILASWKPEGQGAAIISFDWSTHELMVDFNEPFPHAYDPFPDPTKPGMKRVGGALSHYQHGQPLELRILLDGSAVEIFTNTGEVLTTRVYRKTPDKKVAAEERAAALAEEKEVHGSAGVVPGSIGMPGNIDVLEEIVIPGNIDLPEDIITPGNIDVPEKIGVAEREKEVHGSAGVVPGSIRLQGSIYMTGGIGVPEKIVLPGNIDVPEKIGVAETSILSESNTYNNAAAASSSMQAMAPDSHAVTDPKGATLPEPSQKGSTPPDMPAVLLHQQVGIATMEKTLSEQVLSEDLLIGRYGEFIKASVHTIAVSVDENDDSEDEMSGISSQAGLTDAGESSKVVEQPQDLLLSAAWDCRDHCGGGESCVLRSDVIDGGRGCWDAGDGCRLQAVGMDCKAGWDEGNSFVLKPQGNDGRGYRGEGDTCMLQAAVKDSKTGDSEGGRMVVDFEGLRSGKSEGGEADGKLAALGSSTNEGGEAAGKLAAGQSITNEGVEAAGKLTAVQSSTSEGVEAAAKLVALESSTSEGVEAAGKLAALESSTSGGVEAAGKLVALGSIKTSQGRGSGVSVKRVAESGMWAALQQEGGAGVFLFAAGAEAVVSELRVWEMGDCWKGRIPNPSMEKSWVEQLYVE